MEIPGRKSVAFIALIPVTFINSVKNGFMPQLLLYDSRLDAKQLLPEFYNNQVFLWLCVVLFGKLCHYRSYPARWKCMKG